MEQLAEVGTKLAVEAGAAELEQEIGAANHDTEKNPSAPVWQAVFSTSHGVAVYFDYIRATR
jgi:hypothetical protein